MRRHAGVVIILGLIVALGAWVGWRAWQQRGSGGGPGGPAEVRPVAVEVAPVEIGRISERRVLTGTLEAASRFDVAPKIGGRIETLAVDLGDAVARGEVVATLDDDELIEAVAQADADLAVAEAGLAEARSLFRLAEREHERMVELARRGVTTEAEMDASETAVAAAAAAVGLAEAQVARARSLQDLARIRLGQAQVRATWPEDNPGTQAPSLRYVAERYREAGDTVALGAPIVSLVELDPLRAVVFVTERDYARLRAGQRAALLTDAYPGETFYGEIVRLAPVFREASRQARVELRVENPDLRLRPGMFARATLVLRELEDATIVPAMALTRRDGGDVIFLLEEGEGDGPARVRRVPVRVGVVDGDRAQVIGEGIRGEVVILGQQLLDDGTPVEAVRPAPPEEAAPEASPAAPRWAAATRSPGTAVSPARSSAPATPRTDRSRPRRYRPR